MNTVVMMAGGFHAVGAMDKANYELAWHLADRVKTKVFLVSHTVQAELASHPNVIWYYVPRPLTSYALGDVLLRLRGHWIARRLKSQQPRVVVNGGNCPWPDINWVHAFHTTWARRDSHAPLWFRLKATWWKSRARRLECQAITAAKLVLTNSQRTRSQIVNRCHKSPDRVNTVYLGSDPHNYYPRRYVERTQSRQYFGLSDKNPLVAFIGALGRDRNKGFDIAFAAHLGLCQERDWDADLVVAGQGQEVAFWKRKAAEAGLEKRIHFLGFVNEVPRLLAAVDALVSPTHYESYGLNVHEALCCGLPAFVSRTAGIAERYPSDLADFLLCDPPNSIELAEILRRWRKDIAGYKDRVAALSEQLRQRTWEHMAKDIVALL
jgi:glycosyltransferase involved in cell wall biosynthesis